MKNRYHETLREENQKILEISPASPTLRTVLALEFKKLYHKGRVLEIGCGEGDSAESVLKYAAASIDLLDESSDMIRRARQKLKLFSGRTRFITEDGLAYLERTEPYDFILSSWTIHNFKWEDKVNLFRAIYRNLAPGGAFILMDKVYPRHNKRQLLNKQLARYRYLSARGCREITAHERSDFRNEYRMDEEKLMRVLREVGFRSYIADRVERDVVIVAKK